MKKLFESKSVWNFFGLLEKSEAESQNAGRIRSGEELRALWKKSIQQTILLLKIEKEKQDIQSKLTENLFKNMLNKDCNYLVHKSSLSSFS